MTTWNESVLPHGAMTEVAAGLWQVTGSFANMPLPRNMTAWRHPGGGLVLHSVIALREEAMAELEALGEPRVIIVPSGYHRMDAPKYKARFPSAQIVAPRAARRAIEKVVRVAADAEDALPPLGVVCHSETGLKAIERVYEVAAGTGRALVFNDTLMNIPHLPGFKGWFFKVMGSTGFFGMTLTGRVALLADRARYAAWLREMAQLEGLAAICLSHGAPITAGARAALESAAARLD